MSLLSCAGGREVSLCHSRLAWRLGVNFPPWGGHEDVIDDDFHRFKQRDRLVVPARIAEVANVF